MTIRQPSLSPSPTEPSSLFVVCSDESVNVGLFSIFRGFGGGGNRITGELDELHAGFTRDGFHWFRQLPRRALMPFSWPGEHDRMRTIFLAGLGLRSSHRMRCVAEFTPHRSDVQSIANGMLVTEDEIKIFASSRSGLPFAGSQHSPGGNHTVVAATMRRDGFVRR